VDFEFRGQEMRLRVDIHGCGRTSPGRGTARTGLFSAWQAYYLSLPSGEKIRILEIMSRMRRLILTLVMLGLPLQAALAAIMPLCAQAESILAGQWTPAGLGGSAAPCSQHDTDSHDHSTNDGNEGSDPRGVGAADEAGLALSCDGAVCHISGNGLPSAAAVLNLAGGLSYPAYFNSRFTSLIPEQPQRPPLA
jgi:hypothetical protein